MQYSRKGRLIFRGAMFVVAAIWVVFVFLFHPGRNVVPYVGGAVMILCGALAARAYLYLDEIERARRVRISFYGSMLGLWVAVLFVPFVVLQPAVLDVLADILHSHRPHLPLEYFVIGVMVPIIAQVICGVTVSLAMRLKSGA
jgi:hypothetical protein